jgi:hypothetical protein
MKKELNYLASKRWEKVGHQELCSTPYKQEMDPRGGFYKRWAHGVKGETHPQLGENAINRAKGANT